LAAIALATEVLAGVMITDVAARLRKWFKSITFTTNPSLGNKGKPL
jgi:hypothetical protein